MNENIGFRYFITAGNQDEALLSIDGQSVGFVLNSSGERPIDELFEALEFYTYRRETDDFDLMWSVDGYGYIWRFQFQGNDRLELEIHGVGSLTEYYENDAPTELLLKSNCSLCLNKRHHRRDSQNAKDKGPNWVQKNLDRLFGVSTGILSTPLLLR